MLGATNRATKEGFDQDFRETEGSSRGRRLRLARAIFTLRETAGYLDVPKSTIQRWARSQDAEHPLIACFTPHGREATVPFIGFAEAFVLSNFRRAGVPLQRIRPAVEVLEKEIGVDHALACKRLDTDGAEILFDYANKRVEREATDLIVAHTQQGQFSGLVKDYLKRIHYGVYGVGHDELDSSVKHIPKGKDGRALG